MRRHLSYANVIATVSLFIALGGGAYAAFKLPKNSVKSKHIVNGQVKGADVKPDSLGSDEIDESSLGKVPDADKLDGKDSSQFAEAGSDPFTLVGAAGAPGFSTTTDPAGQGCFTPFSRAPEGPAQRGNGDFNPADDWVNYRTNPFQSGGPGPYPAFNEAGFYRDSQGAIHLRGLVRRGAAEYQYCGTLSRGGAISTADDIFRLPAGYRPAAVELIFAVRSNNNPGELRIQTDGDVVAQQGDYEWVSLDGVSFRCAPAGQNGCP